MRTLIILFDPAQDMAPEVPAGEAVAPEIQDIDEQIRQLEVVPANETLSDRVKRLADLTALMQQKIKKNQKLKKKAEKAKYKVWNKMQSLSEEDALQGIAMMRQKAAAKAKPRAKPKAKAKARA